MRIHLYWLDKNWHQKGCADNINLVVNMDKKVYKIYTNPYYGYNKPEDIEVKRKSDILEYIDYLQQNGFAEDISA